MLKYVNSLSQKYVNTEYLSNNMFGIALNCGINPRSYSI